MPTNSRHRKRQLDRLEAGRRALIGAIAELERWVEQSYNPLTGLSPRQQAVVIAAAKTRVLRNPRPSTDTKSLEPFWRYPGKMPARWELDRIARKAIAVIPRLKGLDDQVRPWTAGFWHGLRLSGVLLLHGAYPRLQPGRRWLEDDLERLPVPGRLSVPDHKGRRRLTACQAWRLPIADALGADVLAGLLVGAKRETCSDGVWLALPPTESVLNLLDWWAVSKTLDANRVLVSPFYLALLADQMPPVSAADAPTIRRPGDCPLLPLALWEVAFGAGGPPHHLLPQHAKVLPYICSNSTRKRRGWDRDYLHLAAVGLGVASLSPPMRELLVAWRRKSALMPESPTTPVASPLPDDHFGVPVPVQKTA